MLVAQMDRAPDSEAEGCRFESCQAHKNNSALACAVCFHAKIKEETMFAIKVKFDENSELYITRPVPRSSELVEVLTFASKAEAEKHADAWRLAGKEDNVRVVKYTQV